MKLIHSAALFAVTALSFVPPALAQDIAKPTVQQESPEPQAAASKPISVSGSVAVLSDYRLRGVSQSDRDAAVQGALTIAHDSGFYVGVFASNLAGWGTFGGSNLELDAIGGFRRTIGSATMEAGLTWYMYPGGAAKTDYAEVFAKLSGTAGPATLLAGIAYAPKQEALGTWYRNGTEAAAGIYSDPGDKKDNLYLWGDGAVAVPNTPFTTRAHLGWSRGNSGLGPNATSAAPTGEYWDWQLGADYAVRGTPLTINVSWIDTDITRREAAYLQPSFSKGQDGTGSIEGSTFFASLTAAF